MLYAAGIARNRDPFADGNKRTADRGADVSSGNSMDFTLRLDRTQKRLGMLASQPATLAKTSSPTGFGSAFSDLEIELCRSKISAAGRFGSGDGARDARTRASAPPVAHIWRT